MEISINGVPYIIKEVEQKDFSQIEQEDGYYKTTGRGRTENNVDILRGEDEK